MNETIRGMSPNMMKLLQIAVILIWPTSLFAEAKELKIHALLCYSDLNFVPFIFNEQDDGLLNLIGEDEAIISKTDNVVTVVIRDSVFQFHGNLLQTISNGVFESSVCTDVTESMIILYQEYFEVGKHESIQINPINFFNQLGSNDSSGSADEKEIVTESNDFVADALSAAIGRTETTAGPPITGPERESFRIAVNSCWNVDPGSVAARVTIKVRFTLTQEGLVSSEPRLISSDGDSEATSVAFEAARRAILRCQRGGYQLPANKYDQWKEVVLVFDPAGLRLD
jgi:hypothetical protein